MPKDRHIEKKLKQKRRKELMAYFGEVARREGFFAALGRTLRYFKRRGGGKRGRFLPTKAALQKQREAEVTGWPRISVCVAVYNPPRQFFDAMMASVAAQSYANWELCVVNASDEAPEAIREVLGKYPDRRVKVEQAENEGISENLNRAVRMAGGQYLCFLDHDDILSPDALFEMARRISETESAFLYSDEALFEEDYTRPSAGHFKPDYSPHYLTNVNYIGHLVAVRRDLFSRVGGFRRQFDGAQDHDLYLRITEQTDGAEHIHRVLYYWRQHAGSTSTGTEAKPYVTQAALGALSAHLERIGVRGQAVEGRFPSTYKINYGIQGLPLVSVIIPSCDHVPDLDRCLRSLYMETQYRHFEVLVVENNSRLVETFAYYEELAESYPECRVLVYDGPKGEPFNFSKICNFGRRQARGQFLLFLNNDTEVISPGWMGEMLGLCQQKDVGAVGALLYYPDDSIQHAGVIVGLGGYAGHSHKYARRGGSGYMFRAACVQELSAVTAACMMAERAAFDKVDGFDEAFAVAYNDVDFCLRLRQEGYSVLFTPYAELYHHESKTRGSDEDGAARLRFAHEQELLWERYGEELRHDPFYSPWLTSDREDFSENDVLPEGDLV